MASVSVVVVSGARGAASAGMAAGLGGAITTSATRAGHCGAGMAVWLGSTATPSEWAKNGLSVDAGKAS